MLRAFVVLAVVAVLFGCGGGVHHSNPPAPDTSVSPSFYRPWSGSWIGDVDGRTEGGATVAFSASASLVVVENGLRLEHLCGASGELVTYYLGEDRAYFKAEHPNPCVLPTSCGLVEFDIVSASLMPRDDDKMLAFIALTGKPCGEAEQAVQLAAGMTRPPY